MRWQDDPVHVEEPVPTIEWKDIYSVGVKEIDDQHKHLFEIIGEFSELTRSKQEPKVLFQTLNALVKYADSHFRTEERYMGEHDYPDRTAHEKEHVAFVEEVFSLREQISEPDPESYHKISDFIKNWWISHVLGTDMAFKEFFADKAVT
jgi:hemerythrin-like metal-binding protein